MATIDKHSQLHLRGEIEAKFGALLELLENNQVLYSVVTELNKKFTKYSNNAQMLTDTELTKEFQQL